MRGRRVVVLTGAGISTDSGIPDYRGPQGSLRKRNPVKLQEFLRSETDRRRYWARSCLGWPFLRDRRPNPGHAALAGMQQGGHVGRIITQNVDGLHQAAGAGEVLELHGTLHWVVCLECSTRMRREDLQQRMLARNPGWLERSVEMAPDGDAELPPEITESFSLEPCPICGGTLKPDVVFFGEQVPAARVDAAFTAVRESEVLLVLGSSLTVYSGFRFAEAAARAGMPLIIINRGPTRADRLASLQVDAALSPTLQELAARLGPSAD